MARQPEKDWLKATVNRALTLDQSGPA